MDIEDFVSLSPMDIHIRSPFSDLFPARPGLIETISMSMKDTGYDLSKPVNIWRQENILLDGHQRRQAAIKAGVNVFACFHDFDSEDDALQYAIANQRDRRNLNDAEIASLVAAVDKRRKRGGDRKSEESKASSEAFDRRQKSAEITAELVGVGRPKVEKVRSIFDHAEKTGDDEEKKAVLEGRMSINQAERSVQTKKRKDVKKPKPKDFSTKPKEGDQDRRDGCAEPERSAEDLEYLEGFSIRDKVVTRRFDDDAVIYKHIEPMLSRIREILPSIIGPRSIHAMGSFNRKVHALVSFPDPGKWQFCVKCNGQGVTDSGQCRKCEGCGYETFSEK